MNSTKHLSRVLIGTLIFCFLSAFVFTTNLKAQSETYNNFITVKITMLNSDQHSVIHESVGKTSDTNIEYTCLESGVMVFRMQESLLSEKADIQNYIQNLILEKAKVKSIKFLDFHIERSEGNTKC